MSGGIGGVLARPSGVSDTLLRVNEERGAAIQRRLEALGISDREFYESTGIDRKTLRRAVAGEERVRASTYAAIESALDRLEHEVGFHAPPLPGTHSGDLIEFDITGDFGVHLVVKGPVGDAEVLKRQVVDIIREIRKAEKNDTSESSE